MELEEETVDAEDSEESDKPKTKELSEFEKELKALPENAQKAVRRFRSFVKKCLKEDVIYFSASNPCANHNAGCYVMIDGSFEPKHLVKLVARMFMSSEEIKTYGEQVQKLIEGKNYFMPQVELKVKKWTKKTK